MTKGMKMRMTTPMRASPSECPLLFAGSPTQPSSFPKPSPHLLSPPSQEPPPQPSSFHLLPPSGGWHTSSLSSSLPSSLLIPELPPYPMDGLPGGPTPVTPVIKAGWLDKNPPQG